MADAFTPERIAQLRKILANGTMVVVWAPADKAQRDAENRAWDDARAAMLDAHERRNKLAAKEG